MTNAEDLAKHQAPHLHPCRHCRQWGTLTQDRLLLTILVDRTQFLHKFLYNFYAACALSV
ncbi:MAG: hypothetical protein JGK26_06080 [Microcoleus sp. PH2017_27_LUM_O_A]|uniref:hypothetical protein n=1 Tax=unclassified Microcoleus TaxID=2642155 RepID=UPI001D9AED49|nr:MULTISPECIES: hypothetical protein [unclassified Microcoleus]MCC3459399.1 hypothetical protein [Microcoleus sp. PH2017_11_PCY_U_A]TAE81317.1 MAG: hypothetical protein EAZ83_15755 [Oscillatoriales cyanobacterium]MCC3558699.1 hypothetical protein [Microcoleus sp. PH2017_27_LUM_O_A]TAE98780.1 MAG: hypothetical protein EAZ79_06675 [Oscillatoriales cyanobacterium]TAF22101.1 MAG: hypothetical protein EAZ73_06885 [Oscillatoriales cyanobacterium]